MVQIWRPSWWNFNTFLYRIGNVSVKMAIFDDRGLTSMTSKTSKYRHLTSNEVKVSDASEFSKFDVYVVFFRFMTIYGAYVVLMWISTIYPKTQDYRNCPMTRMQPLGRMANPKVVAAVKILKSRGRDLKVAHDAASPILDQERSN